MINEQLAPTERPITSLPNNRPKNKESLEIAALTAEFLANGGTIKQANSNKINKQQDFLPGDVSWHELPKVLRIMRKKYITKSALSKKTKIKFSLLSKFLSGEQLPDMRERGLILTTVENWG